MTFKDLKKFIKIEDQHIRKYFNDEDEEKRALIRTVKLTEEVGELAAEILTHYGWQRKEKIDKRSIENLNHEFADVLITTFLLANVMKVDPERALQSKIKKLKKRYHD